MSLDEFESEVQKTLKGFAADYRKNHAENPEAYPLRLPESDDGLWWEFVFLYPGEGK